VSDVPALPDAEVDPSESEVTTALRASPRLIAAAIGTVAAAALLGGGSGARSWRGRSPAMTGPAATPTSPKGPFRQW
jgi:hypothetical protein